MLPIHFAPIQGQTDLIYRTLHHQLVGGIHQYHTPFVRWERDGLRNKDRRDIDPAANASQPTVAQVIFRDRDEFCHLLDTLQQLGWSRIDLNLGCPFPLQTHAGRGSGMLQKPQTMTPIIQEMQRRTEVRFSAKMRLGMDSKEEGLVILQMLNDVPLSHLTIHPRLGRQQYKGTVDMESFREFLAISTNPVVYNGDITTPEQIVSLEEKYPQLAGVMIGRGLLMRPTLAQEYTAGQAKSPQEQMAAVMVLHSGLFDHAQRNLQGDSQILARMQAFWEFHREQLDKKTFKALTRCTILRTYREALNGLK